MATFDGRSDLFQVLFVSHCKYLNTLAAAKTYNELFPKKQKKKEEKPQASTTKKVKKEEPAPTEPEEEEEKPKEKFKDPYIDMPKRWAGIQIVLLI